MDNIFGIGGPELLLILVLATVVLGPLRMIQMARGFGRLVRDLRNYSRELMSGLNEELAFLDEAKEVIREGVDAASLKPEEVKSIFSGPEPSASTGSGGAASPQVDAASPQPQEVLPVSLNPESRASTGSSDEASPGQTNVGLVDQIPLSSSHNCEGDVSAEPVPVNTIQTSADSAALAPPSTSDSHELNAIVEPSSTNLDPT
jgi:Sec-independent protein translocase protein TatA